MLKKQSFTQETPTVHLFRAGSCTHNEAMTIRGGQRKKVVFPALVALIEHPVHGRMLFDTGYAPRFFKETKKYPYKIYAQITPVTCREEDTALASLKKTGFDSGDIDYVFISHFHADHISGLRDFPHSKFIYSKDAWKQVQGKTGFSALLNGFLPGLMPDDFFDRAVEIHQFAQKPYKHEKIPFDETLDLFGDEQVLAVSLPGHFSGQLGLIVNSENLGKIFLCADAVWHKQCFEENRLPHLLTALIHHSWPEYKRTVRQIRQFWKNNPEVKIIPTHCKKSQMEYF
ncbi:MAG: MBL fold metallo-hydrolase [Halobacteriovoraceae bacterium]|nr:MBL fold metallo-hydrolase [Halobacteriovoraceae bacterium]